ncbi:MAG TPA: glycoside hydrolase family 31 protein [Ktedonobacterales bacterium]|nr:glycoside hydrolase family 31 protein [Ktedonobacterales bacterium]
MQGFFQQGQSISWSQNNETLRVEPWGPESFRVRATVNGAIRDDLFSVLLSPAETEAHILIAEDGATIRNGTLTAHISPAGYLRFVRSATGEEVLAEIPTEFSPRRWARSFRAVQGDLFHLTARFRAYEGERLYGLGQHQHGRLNQKGCVIDLLQRNTEVSIPFLLSSRGYGLLWHNPAIGRVELGHTETRWVAEATHQLDYWVTAGATPSEILGHYADATGHAPAFPEWAAGFWQSKLRYHTQEEVLSVAREYKRRGLPLAMIVIDFFHWTLQGDWRFDPEAWPDPAEMVRELDELGVKVMVSVWPTVNALSRNFTEMQARGLLVRTERGLPALLPFRDNRPEGPAYLSYYDATNPEARQFIWEQVRQHYYTYGIKHWWLDVCEPEMHPSDEDNLRFYLGNGAAVATAYPLLHEQGFAEQMRAEGEESILNLCRSAWAGSQRYGTVIWSGDINSTFEALQAQVRAGLNIGLSGIPWWTTDIGGFHGGNPDSPAFRELIIRWFQYGAFCPIFRLHGHRRMKAADASELLANSPNEAWSFGEEAYAIIKELLFLRERLRPYILEQMQLAHERGIPPMRPLFFDFFDDEQAADIDDQFLFGPDLLVAPVLHAGERQREVYLPAGTTWTDAWTSQTLEGGQRLLAAAPLERIPLYVRGQAHLPL